MTDFGILLKRVRKTKGISQQELAKRLSMSPVQLCKIEKGTSSPTLNTVERISTALGVSISGLLFSNDTIENYADKLQECNSRSNFYSVRNNATESKFDKEIIDAIFENEQKIFYLEARLGIKHSTFLPFVHSFNVDQSGAKTVAKYMRAACAVGSASFSDLAEILELRNVRLHIVRLPKDIQSRSYFDSVNHSLSIVLSQENTVERNTYRIAYELAWMILSGSMGFVPVKEEASRHRFAREFASEFLMPEESVRFAAAQLGIRPEDWTFTMVCYLKAKFNVSAESFALRLEALGLINTPLRESIRDELHEYYKKHPEAMEPEPHLSSLNIGHRTKLLEMEVERRGQVRW